MPGSRASSACASSRPSSRRPDARATSPPACSTCSDARPRERSASCPQRRKAGSLSKAPSRARTPARASSPSATSAAARRSWSSARSCSGLPGSGRSTSDRFASPPRCSRATRPAEAEIESARAVVQSGLAELDPPRPELALATGGSARAVARVVGHEYGADDLERVVALLAARPAAESAKALGLRADRAHTLLAGAMILAQVSRLIGIPFAPSRGGIREGAALRLAARRVAA